MTKTIVAHTDDKPLKIMLLEDDDGDARALERAFEKAGITNPITRVVDGIEALEILQGGNFSSPFVIISDINMPRMDGIKFLQTLRSDPELSRSIVFMLTTSKSEGDIFLSYNSHAAGYICKQTAGQDFLGLITLMSSYWHIVELPE